MESTTRTITITTRKGSFPSSDPSADRSSICSSDTPHIMEATATTASTAIAATTAKNKQYKRPSGISARTEQNKRRKARQRNNKVRFHQFADFCVDTFTINTDHGILDVAGGKARMALEFCLERRIPCTVVDPRFSRLSEFTARRIAHLAVDAAANHNNTTVIVAAAVTVAAVAAETKDDELASSPPSYQLAPSEFFRNQDQADPIKRQKIDSFMEHIGFSFHQCLFNEEYCRTNAAIWKNASLVIGMHPDEATEAIVDEALKVGKSFAVVPCCVFPSLFHERRLVSGRTVRSLPQFIEYLAEKHVDIKVRVLDGMPGCNTVVYKV